MKIPLPLKRLMINPLTVMPVPVSLIPSAPPALAPLNSMRGLPAKPGWVVASSSVGWAMAGSAVLGEIVLAPEPMANLMVSSAIVLLASRMAWRTEPAPLSAVVVTA